METILIALPYVQVTLSILLIIAVLMQRSAAGLGAGFGVVMEVQVAPLIHAEE